MERKVKYDYAFKLKCVQSVLIERSSIELFSRENSIHKSIIHRWIILYNKFGESGLLPRINQIYSIEFKLKVLKTIAKKYLSLSEACLEFNIPSNSIIVKWQKDFANFGIEGLQPKPKGRQKSMSDYKRKKRKSDKPLTREEELLLENERLRCENEFLKKLQALIQAEEEAKKRKQ